MIRNTTLFLSSLFAGACFAQTHHALDFDGIDDQVTVNNGSAGVANATAITLGCWVYPTNDAPAYPDFDGFAGFRNEFDADFYLLQISPANTVEGRMRNDAGEAVTLTLENLALNTWQYLTLVYDGTDLRLYRNGVEASSAPMSGTIVGATEAFHIGNIPYTLTDFMLDGKVDEVALWSRALTAEEIQCAMHDVALSDTALELYYKCDQGVAGGANTGLTTLQDLSDHADGTLSGFALSGSTSNYVQGVGFGGGVTTATSCADEPYVFHGQTFTGPGIGQVVVGTSGGCDSLATLVLDATTVNVNVIQVGNTLTSTAPTGPYQWLDCGNGYAPVSGGINQSYTPTASGQYALRRVNGACADTSDCYTVTITGIDEVRGGIASVVPSPAMDQLTVRLEPLTGGGVLRVMDLDGREVLRMAANGQRTVGVDVSMLAPGVYVLHLQAAQASGAVRFVKQ